MCLLCTYMFIFIYEYVQFVIVGCSSYLYYFVASLLPQYENAFPACSFATYSQCTLFLCHVTMMSCSYVCL
jgi:hypothetical protein